METPSIIILAMQALEEKGYKFKPSPAGTPQIIEDVLQLPLPLENKDGSALVHSYHHTVKFEPIRINERNFYFAVSHQSQSIYFWSE